MKNLLKGSQKFLKKNSATILTVTGALGVVATAVTTAQATTKADALLREAKEYKGAELTFDEKVRLAAPIYIPAALTGIATITCIFGANILNKRTQTSLIGAYTVLDQSFKTYKEKVKELYGKEGHDHVVDEVVREDAKNAPRSYEFEMETFYDLYSGRYFENTMENVLKAENETNKRFHTDGAISINDLYIMIGLEPKPEFDEIGWSYGAMEEMYWHNWVEFEHRKVVLDDGMECILLEFPLDPIVDFDNY